MNPTRHRWEAAGLLPPPPLHIDPETEALVGTALDRIDRLANERKLLHARLRALAGDAACANAAEDTARVGELLVSILREVAT